MLKLFRTLLLTVLKEDTKQFKDSVISWLALESLWNELVTPITEDETRGQKADKVKTLAEAYLVAFATAVSADRVTVYMHIAADHFPTMIRLHGDLLEFAGEGLENLHTRIAATGNNKRRRSEGTNTRGRTWQSFEQVTVARMLEELVPGPKDMRAQRDLASKLNKRKQD